MKRNELIKKIIGEAIEPRGFKLLGFERKFCVYEKQIDELKQDIFIQFSGNIELKLDFTTNAYGQRAINAGMLVKEDEDRGDVLGFFSYNNEQELIKLLEYFKKIIFDYGFDELEKMSVSTTEIRPTKEMERYLFENHEELNKQYRKKFNIEDDTNYEIVFKIAQDYVVETQGKEFSEIKKDLIGLAAVIGTIFVEDAGGEWKWHTDSSVCFVANKAKYPIVKNVLNSIIHFWREAPEYTCEMFNNDYKWLCEMC